MIPYLAPRWRIILGWASMAIAVVLLSSCSSTAAIANALGDVRETAKSAAEKQDAIIAEATATEPDLKAIANLASATKSDLHTIESYTESASRHLTGAKDITPAWLSAVLWIAAAAVVLGVVVLLWRTGLDRFVASLLSLFSVPSKSATAAKLDADALAESPTPALRESVAAKRASSHRYDIEFQKRKRRLDEASGAAVRKETKTDGTDPR